MHRPHKPAAALTAAKIELLREVICDIRAFRFCGPSDESDAQSATTLGFSHLVVHLKRLAAPILAEPAASRLSMLEVDVHDIYSAFAAKGEVDALLPDLESALAELPSVEFQGPLPAPKPLPVPVCVVVGDVLGSHIYNHKAIETLFFEAGAVGPVPEGNCVKKCRAWLKRMHNDVPEPVAVLGKVLEEFMEVDDEWRATSQLAGRQKINEVLGKAGLSYTSEGLIIGVDSALPTKSLNQVLRDRDLPAVDREFERALLNVEKDPATAITAACSILESLFKVYIEDEGMEMPADQSLKPLWKTASRNIGFDPAALEDDDLKKVLSGLNSVVDGIGALRTHAGSAHGRGRQIYRLQARHARLATHASHTLVGFFMETWDERKRKETVVRQRSS